MSETKTCVDCNEEKPLSEFYADNAVRPRHPNPPYYASRCIACASVRTREYRQSNNHALTQVINRQKKKKILVEELGGCCSECGYSEDIRKLQFHHLRDKSFTICERLGCSLETLRKEAVKCKLVCYWCHIEIHTGKKVTRGHIESDS